MDYQPMLAISKETTLAVICGVLSGGVFSLIADTIGGGMLAVFLPVLPLAFAGLALSARHCLIAAISACAAIALLSDAGYILFFALFLAVPLMHFIRRCLLWRGGEGEREWYPTLAALSEVTLFSAGVFMVFALISVHAEHIPLKSIVAGTLSSQQDNLLKDADPSVSRYIKLLANQWSFLVFAVASWIWTLLIYAVAALVNALLASKAMSLRPHLAITPEGLPLWLPAALLISAALALLGHGNDSFAGETLFVIMLLPYFLSGLASVHRFLGAWPAKKIWLTAFYVLLALFPWAAALLIARGAYTQLEKILGFTQ
jgi:hypothetical protein